MNHTRRMSWYSWVATDRRKTVHRVRLADVLVHLSLFVDVARGSSTSPRRYPIHCSILRNPVIQRSTWKPVYACALGCVVTSRDQARLVGSVVCGLMLVVGDCDFVGDAGIRHPHHPRLKTAAYWRLAHSRHAYLDLLVLCRVGLDFVRVLRKVIAFGTRSFDCRLEGHGRAWSFYGPAIAAPMSSTLT